MWRDDRSAAASKAEEVAEVAEVAEVVAGGRGSTSGRAGRAGRGNSFERTGRSGGGCERRGTASCEQLVPPRQGDRRRLQLQVPGSEDYEHPRLRGDGHGSRGDCAQDPGNVEAVLGELRCAVQYPSQGAEDDVAARVHLWVGGVGRSFRFGQEYAGSGQRRHALYCARMVTTHPLFHGAGDGAGYSPDTCHLSAEPAEGMGAGQADELRAE